MVPELDYNNDFSNELSGIACIEYNQNSTGWQDGASFVSSEGDSQVEIKVYDVAGNVASGFLEIKVDTTRPVISYFNYWNTGIGGLVC